MARCVRKLSTALEPSAVIALRSLRATCSAGSSPKKLGSANSRPSSSTAATRRYFQRAYWSIVQALLRVPLGMSWAIWTFCTLTRTPSAISSVMKVSPTSVTRPSRPPLVTTSSPTASFDTSAGTPGQESPRPPGELPRPDGGPQRAHQPDVEVQVMDGVEARAEDLL